MDGKSLLKWLAEKKMSIAEMARQLGVSRDWMSQIAHGGSCSLPLMLKIEEFTGGEVTIKGMLQLRKLWSVLKKPDDRTEN